MSSQSLLLEIGLEEVPARFVTSSMNQLGENVEKWLKEKRISYGDVQLYSTPRRLAVLIKDVADAQEDIEEEAKGPAKKIALDENGNWTKAAIGFSRGQGMTTEDIYFKKVKDVEYAYVNKFIKGKKTFTLLPELKQVVTGLHFPNNMTWGDYNLRYVRPLRWLTVLFGKEVVPLSIAGVDSDRYTYGHRFLGEKAKLTAADHYEEALLSEYVITDPNKRKQTIKDQVKKIEEEQGWIIPKDESLLEEVNNLVEYPTALYGSFDQQYLNLPAEVLITSMKEHQRYFPVKDEKGQLLPFFITVRNGDDQHIENVAKGNEKVLRARLADADFFFKEDQKLEIETALKELQQIVHHEKIGTLAEKVARTRKMTNKLTEMLSFSEEDKAYADRAAEICKFDLVTNMVDEFPELQGIMGEKYALLQGEDKQVATAVREHYEPRHSNEEVPQTNIGAVVAVADKIDTIVSSFAVGLIPTGSQDPYALRRQATGIVQIFLDRQWNLSVIELLKEAIKIVEDNGVPIKDADALLQECMNFFQLRLKYTLQELNIRYDIIEAILKGPFDGLLKMVQRAKVLNASKDEETFKQTIEALSRVLNIAKKAEGITSIDPSLFDNKYEKDLYENYVRLEEKINQMDMEQKFKSLASLRDVIEKYFDHTMVMVENAKLKQNRLSQMKKLADIIQSYAKMTEIIVK